MRLKNDLFHNCNCFSISLFKQIIQTTQCIQDLKGFIEKNSKFNDLENILLKIDFFYRTYESYVNRSELLEKETLEKFAYNVIDDNSMSVKGCLQQVYGILLDRGLLNTLTHELRVSLLEKILFYLLNNELSGQ